MNSSANVTINSGHVANALDSQIVMLTKTLQVENPDSTFEDALRTTQLHLHSKILELMTEEDKQFIIESFSIIQRALKKNPNDEAMKRAYKVCKYFGIHDLS